MAFKVSLMLVVLTVIIGVSLITLLLNRKEDKYTPGVSEQTDMAVNQAQTVLEEKKKLKINLSDGPCLSNDLLQDWVADIVHDPRTEVDNLAKNQCPAFIEGRAKHFVELDVNGNVVRVK